jgi:glucose-6-phosphate dehydrogenase assembly protein OpcA
LSEPLGNTRRGGGGAKTVIARLEKELRDLWLEPQQDPKAPVSRVVTMNLEVVAPSRELLERYTPVVDEVTASIPARAILASLEPDAAGDDFDGNVTAVCWNTSGKKICSERITIHARGGASARAASAIEAFLVPEIPTALVWLGRVHVDDPVFQDLANDAHRILLDSEYTSMASLVHVAAWARKQSFTVEVADLAWTRLAPWQEMIARFFDDARHRDLAERIDKIRLTQASDAGARLGAEPSLLLGWVATRLGWKVQRLGGSLRMKRPDGGSVALELVAVPRPQGVAPQALAAVHIEAQHDGVRLGGAIERHLGSGRTSDDTKDADIILWRQVTEPGNAIEQRVRLGANKAAKWLERTLHRPRRDPAFDESVAFAEQIVEDGLTVS